MDRNDAALVAAHAEVKAEISRTDTKASVLLAFNGALLAGVWTVATSIDLPASALLVGAAGVVALVTAVALLLGTVRPNLGGRMGFPLWATLSAEEIRLHLREERIAADIGGLSCLAVAKFARLRRAIDCTRTAGALFVAAAAVAVVGAVLGGTP